MISTFDLTLLGSMVSAGGLAFLRQGKWPLDLTRLAGRTRVEDLTAESRDHYARSTALAAARWLTVGALTLLVAYARGGESGYLFNLWGDVMFHVLFVASCWSFTAFRINHTAERAATRALKGKEVTRTTAYISTLH